MMRALAIAASLAVLAIAIAPIPEVEARPPDLPPDHSGCNYFHYHNGDVLAGVPPTYHYHHCI